MPAPKRQAVRRSASLNGTADALMSNFIDSVLLVPMAPGWALASVQTDILDIATDKVGHIGHRRDISDRGSARTQILVALRDFATPTDRWAEPRRRRWMGVAFQIGLSLVVVTRSYSEFSVVCEVKVLLEVG